MVFAIQVNVSIAIEDLGDTVLIRRIERPERPTAIVMHKVERVVFKYGNVIDPITKKRVVQDEFSDEIELKKQLVKEVIEDPFQQVFHGIFFQNM